MEYVNSYFTLRCFIQSFREQQTLCDGLRAGTAHGISILMRTTSLSCPSFSLCLRDESPLSRLHRAPIQSQLHCNSPHSLNAKRNMRFQLHAQSRRPVHNVRPVHAPREGLVFHFLL